MSLVTVAFVLYFFAILRVRSVAPRSLHRELVEKLRAGDVKEARKACDHVIEIPPCPHYTAVVPAAVALQLFAYHVARIRGCAIDQPRNLAKSVTVE